MTIKWQPNPNSGNEDWGDEVDWKPEAAGQLVGVLVGKRMVPTKYGDTTVLKIKDDAGIVYNVWCSRAGLKNLVAEKDEELIIGREVGLKTDGPVKLKNSQTFFPYEIGFGEFTQAKTSTPDRAEEPVEEPF